MKFLMLAAIALVGTLAQADNRKIEIGIYETPDRPDLTFVKGAATVSPSPTPPFVRIVKTRPIVEAGSQFRIAKGGAINLIDNDWGKYDLPTFSAQLAYGKYHSCLISVSPIKKEYMDSNIRLTDETTWVVESSHHQIKDPSIKMTEESCFLLEPARREWCQRLTRGGLEPVVPDAIVFHAKENPKLKMWLLDTSAGGIENMASCINQAGIEKF